MMFFPYTLSDKKSIHFKVMNVLNGAMLIHFIDKTIHRHATQRSFFIDKIMRKYMTIHRHVNSKT